MDGWQVRWWIAAMAIACAATAEAQPAPPSAARGELLYKTHCGGCHTTQVHWRDRKLAGDWKGLQDQVRRWQRNTGLKWSEQEIADVTRYLNGEFYHFAPPARLATADILRERLNDEKWTLDARNEPQRTRSRLLA